MRDNVKVTSICIGVGLAIFMVIQLFRFVHGGLISMTDKEDNFYNSCKQSCVPAYMDYQRTIPAKNECVCDVCKKKVDVK